MDAGSLAALHETIVSSNTPAVDNEFTKIWPDNVAIVEAFLAVATQWRVLACTLGGGLGATVPVYIALDYAAVRAGLDAENIAVTPELWRGLRVMESAAAAALNEAD